ncbi:cytidine deaminase [Candidatus Vecturithrix granuli]|uniref:Cytidine deaminase n=1 Tax=Vecturithrix granuli TaxID=1499967 RepID=A0A081BZN9_VECG1|nr:cytidine deaminase [Candidatus Vecturithrix granuli]
MSIRDTLIQEAKQARLSAYTPYSHFKVGAAVYTKSEKIFRGCNIENSSYGATVCAERVALFTAYSQEEREIDAIAIVADTETPCPPCGICRQVIIELAGDIEIILANLRDDVRVLKASELLPDAFTSEFL